MGNDVKAANVDEIAAQHAERKAVPHLDDAPPPPESPAAGQAVDSKGIPFNDAIHARKKDGSPAKTKGGVWRKKTQTTLLEDSKPVQAATVIDPRQGAHTAAVQTCSMMEIAFVGLTSFCRIRSFPTSYCARWPPFASSFLRFNSFILAEENPDNATRR